MKIHTRDLIGAALDWAVAKCEGRTIVPDPMAFRDGSFWIWEEVPSESGGVVPGKSAYKKIGSDFSPATDWSLAGPIIEREGILLRPLRREGHAMDGLWLAMFDGENTGSMVQWVKRTDWPRHYLEGSTALVAAMRCYVASKLGDSVEVPDSLLEGLKA